ncbi:MAG: sarcosine oxidase subunit gamma [Candidatus Marinimicrobia bacterium]|nr:sarcosine oxidase subunit gamma [Candidatus Neomarinimicrobiota bacterium]
MNNSKENLMLKFASTFQPLIDQEGYLVNQNDVSCREVFGNALAILRTSKDNEKSKKDAKEILDVDLPEELSMTTNSVGVQCLWISPDEFWLLHSQQKKAEIWNKIESLPIEMSMVDNSAAYGVLEFIGEKVNKLLSRWMSYDLSGSLNSGKVVSTTLGQAPVIVFRTSEGKLMIMVRHSFSHYVAGLLKDSAKRI